MRKKIVRYQYHNSPNIWEKEMTEKEYREHKNIFGSFVRYKKRRY